MEATLQPCLSSFSTRSFVVALNKCAKSVGWINCSLWLFLLLNRSHLPSGILYRVWYFLVFLNFSVNYLRISNFSCLNFLIVLTGVIFLAFMLFRSNKISVIHAFLSTTMFTAIPVCTSTFTVSMSPISISTITFATTTSTSLVFIFGGWFLLNLF